MLEINELSFAYDNKKPVLDHVSFKLESGVIYCLLGVNGAGKTTLFNCLSGFLNHKLLYIQDEMHFYKNLTGLEFSELILSLKGKQLDMDQFDQLLEKLRMTDYKNERISTYSLGQSNSLF